MSFGSDSVGLAFRLLKIRNDAVKVGAVVFLLFMAHYMPITFAHGTHNYFEKRITTAMKLVGNPILGAIQKLSVPQPGRP